MFAILGVLCLLQTLTLAPAQLFTLKDGNVGVNFAGFHAGAGLGGLLTGNAAHGGLSASAGTPWGSNAAAGLAGDLDGRAAGVGYATAQANPSVGAGVVMGGVAGEHGFVASEAYSPGRADVTIDTVHRPQPVTSAPLPTVASHVQKVKPPKKYSLINQDSNRRVNRENHVEIAADPSTPLPPLTPASSSPSALAPIYQPVVPSGSLIIVKRPRLQIKRERQRLRTVYVMQQQQQQQQQQQEKAENMAEVVDAVEQEDGNQQSDEVPAKSYAKVVHTQRYRKTAQRPQIVNQHVIAPQGSPVTLALDIPIGILRSLQQSLGALGGGKAAAVPGVTPPSG